MTRHKIPKQTKIIPKVVFPHPPSLPTYTLKMFASYVGYNNLSRKAVKIQKMHQRSQGQNLRFNINTVMQTVSLLRCDSLLQSEINCYRAIQERSDQLIMTD